MRVSLHLALLSANSRLLMSLSRTLYLFICSQMMSSTHLKKQTKKKMVEFANHRPRQSFRKPSRRRLTLWSC